MPSVVVDAWTHLRSCVFVFCRREVERRTHPLSKADFVLLEAELESWRQQQTAAIKNAGLVQQEEQVRPDRDTVGVLRLGAIENCPCSHTQHPA